MRPKPPCVTFRPALVPLTQHLHISTINAATFTKQRNAALSDQRRQVSPLRSTIHAGEDFARLIQGLRRMHEPIEYGLLQFGDRIGHGLALGFDPKLWAERLPQTPQTLDERLDDLVSRY